MLKIPFFKIVRASRRSISIQISKTKGLVIRAPFSVPEDIIHAFIEKKSDWITKHITQYDEHEKRKNNSLYYLGQVHSFEYNLLQKELVVHSEDMFTFSEKVRNSGTEQAILIKWYRERAQLHMSERVAYFSRKHELLYKKIRITSATTRWGSCSGHNNLNFPWKLMMAPKEVIDYVVVHELAHTVHKNHSKYFWRLVESITPDWKKYRIHLKEEGWKYILPEF